MPELGTLPPRIAKLPIDSRGWPVPWFVDWITNADGVAVPDHRTMDPRKFYRAIKDRLCWVCGEPLGRWLAFPIGPMCTITRTTPEPPSHRECVEWSVQHCPFLSNPEMVRRHEHLPTDAMPPPGLGLKRNPGVMCEWITRTYETFRVPSSSGNLKHLITVGEPTEVRWWREGRTATRAEVEESVTSGLPNLLAAARIDGPFAVKALGEQAARAEALWPK
ncbi:MAG TPA: hypothetical protein VGR63_13105 [Casimicrobiaceae bacterium]|nr:hypothetical protein [Casimicrobiaceae bacterium]